MQHVHAPSTGRGRLALLAVVLAAVALAASLAAPAAFASGITCTVTPATVDYGHAVTVQGGIDPLAADQTVTVSLNGTDVGTANTDAGGNFSVPFTPTTGGVVTARLADATTSAPVTLVVNPVLTVKVSHVAFFSSATVSVTVLPATYAGGITVKALRGSRTVGQAHVTAKSGTTKLKVPIWGVGKFKVQVTLAAWSGLAARSASKTFHVRGHNISAGSRGVQVKALLKALVGLHFRVPGISSSMSYAAADAVVAFQKAYRLPRTYVFDQDDWRKLSVAKLLRPRYANPDLHIEVDKTKQILMVVKNGVPRGILAVSTGRTGNTPEGTHHILWKAPAATTPYGHGLLYWNMCFYPGFAMHAYPSVPPYPASHGCVRQPTWVAHWTYSQSYTGETVYVFH